MRRDSHLSVSAVLLAFMLAVVPAVPALAQWTPDRLAAGESELPRTPWGAPDLQGVWNNSTTTPLERLTREEQAQGREAQQAVIEATRGTGAGWLEQAGNIERESLIIDPPDGRIRMAETARTVQVGSTIKDFSAPGLDGKSYALEDSLADNKIVLIEFWASWCGPCRTEVPTLKTALAQYGERGFDIFAFSLDDNREDWEVASEEDGITWVNTCDLKAYDSPIPAQFGVLAIPMNVIVDAEGVILGKYVRGERLLETLDELLPGES